MTYRDTIVRTDPTLGIMPTDIFHDFDFSLLDSREFKEDAVREEIVLPLLNALGYSAGGLQRIVRSKKLDHPLVRIGSKERRIHLFPDYLLLVDSKYAWAMDAKGPEEEIKTGGNVEQAYSYAIHPDVRVGTYVLCNGRELTVFKVSDSSPVLYLRMDELAAHWDELYDLLSPAAFQASGVVATAKKQKPGFDYIAVKPVVEITRLKKQSAKRHFGVHPYFTKQVWNVVQEYIKSFSQPGDVVLDPFGGSGVTVIEALILGRKGIHIDLNPLSVFIVETLLLPVSIARLGEEFDRIRDAFQKNRPLSKPEIEQALKRYPYPKGFRLPKNSDVEYVEELFSPQQLAQLAYLKHLIRGVSDTNIQRTLLLMFSGLLNKINLTYHASGTRTEGRGDSGVFRYYRYRIAPKPAALDVMKYFDLRFKKIVAAKRELGVLANTDALTHAEVYAGSATNLDRIADESVDYIYTDPPYGKKIAYLDLSVMWNAWLDLEVTKEAFQLEAIEGGELDKGKSEYASLLSESIKEMYRVLRFDRWMSFVFAHKDPAYWHLIVETAESCGFEYMGAIKQSNDKVTFKKHQNPFTVLSGQLIISFKKVRNPKTILKVGLGADISDLILETIESVIAQHDGATLEQINDELILKGLELGFLDVLSKQYTDLTPLLLTHFSFDPKTKLFGLPVNTKFQSRIDVRLRIRYYLLSFMRRMEREGHDPTFDEIVLSIMPLLKNGITPQTQTILGVLEELATHRGHDRWRLKSVGQFELL